MHSDFQPLYIHLRKEHKKRLLEVKNEIKFITGTTVPLNRLINEIIGEFLDRVDLEDERELIKRFT